MRSRKPSKICLEPEDKYLPIHLTQLSGRVKGGTRETMSRGKETEPREELEPGRRGGEEGTIPSLKFLTKW